MPQSLKNNPETTVQSNGNLHETTAAISHPADSDLPPKSVHEQINLGGNGKNSLKSYEKVGTINDTHTKFNLTENALTVLQKRYLMKNEDGEVIESPEQLFRRVAQYIASADALYSAGGTEETEAAFFDMLMHLEFLPNSPTLMNAGRELGQLSACFVLPVEDSMDSIFETVKNTALIHKSGGGTGFSFSRIRPNNDIVKSTKGVSSGPISFMGVFDAATETIKQGGCLVPDTLIHTATGTFYLSELCDMNNKGWKDHDLQVPTDEGIKDSKQSYNNGVEKTLKIITKDGFELCGTLNHKVKVFSEKGLVWKKLEELQKGDLLFVKLGQHHGKKVKLDTNIGLDHPNQNDCQLPEELTEELAFWLGYLLGDGFVASGDDDYRVGMSIHNDSYLFHKIEKLTQNLFDVSMTKYTKENDNSTTFVITNKKLKTFLKKNELDKQKSEECVVPEKIRISSPTIVGAFLRGLFEADGGLTYNYPSLTTVSERMAKEVCVLLRGLGIPNNISINANRSTSFGDKQVYVIKVLSAIGLKRYIETIGFDEESRFQKLSLDNIYLSKEKNFVLPNYKEIINKVLYEITEPQKEKRARGKGKKFRSVNSQLRRSLLRYLREDRKFSASSYLYYSEKYEDFRNFAPALDFLDYFDEVSEVKESGGKLTVDLSVEDNHTYIANGFVTHNTRRGANMAILRVDHPDILEFIAAKKDHQKLNNFNISVAITDKFMQALKNDEAYPLINPRTKKIVKNLRAKEVFDLITQLAWENGDPGVVFIDEINRHNPTPHIGEIESTNPCGEQPLLAYESCNLGSINLAKFVKNGQIDYDHLQKIVRTAIHFLDNVIDKNRYPIPEISKMTLANRKIGLGVMGYSDMLIQCGIPYNSEIAVELAQKIMEFITTHAQEKSIELAEKRGPFPNFKGSIFDKPGKPAVRNATTTTIAPTGTISIIAGCSSGVEPLFALCFVRNVLDNQKLLEINPYFEQVARAHGFYSQELMEQIAARGTVKGLEAVPGDIQNLFVSSHDITPEWHVRMQAAFQQFTENAVSKTVNFPNSATVEDVKNVYLLAHKLGCKGITIYRDGSREIQVLTKGTQTEKPASPQSDLPINKPKKRPKVLSGKSIRMETGCGTLYVSINSDENGPFEVFNNMGKAGGCAASQNEAVGRLVSLAWRSGIKTSEIVKQLRGISCHRPYGFGPNKVLSCADAIAQAISQHADDKMEAPKVNLTTGACPECGSPMEQEGGCSVCHVCGFSECA